MRGTHPGGPPRVSLGRSSSLWKLARAPNTTRALFAEQGRAMHRRRLSKGRARRSHLLRSGLVDGRHGRQVSTDDVSAPKRTFVCTPDKGPRVAHSVARAKVLGGSELSVGSRARLFECRVAILFSVEGASA